jgi:hypothetical protein
MPVPKTRSKPSVKTEPAHRGLDMDKARQKQKEVEDRSSGDFLELKEGWTCVYLLPPWSEEGVIWKEVEQHGRLVCPKRTAGKDCMICDEMVKRGRKGDSDFVEQHKMRSRAFFNCVRKEDIRKLLSAPASVVKVLAVSHGVFREILEYINDEDIDPSNPETAVPLGIKRTGKGMRTRYKVKFGDATDISKYVTAKVMEVLHDLDVLRAAQPATTKDMRKAIRGAADEEDDDFDGDEEDITDEDTEEQDDADGSEGAGSEEDEVFEEPEDGAEEEQEEEDGDEAEGEEEIEDEGDGEEGDEDAEPEEDEPEEDGPEEEPEEEEPEEEEPPPRPRKPVKPAAKLVAKPTRPAAKPVVKPAPKVATRPKPGALAAKVKASVKSKQR